jgi:outer membrane protein, heavy metal efflux system
MLVIISGCATGRNRGISQSQWGTSDATRLASVETTVTLTDSTNGAAGQTAETAAMQTRLVAYQEEVLPTHDDSESIFPPIVGADDDTGLSLANLEEIAMANNPTLVQSSAQIDGARGAAYQAGLYPNPVVGYEGEFDSIGRAPDETWNGGFIAQEFITAGKLRLSREKWRQRAVIAQTNLHAQQHRVMNDVRAQFYRTLAAQRLVDIFSELLSNGEDNLQTLGEMLNLGQTNQSGLLRAEVDLQLDRLSLKQAEYELEHAWRTLTSMIGVPELAQTSLIGPLKHREEPLDWDSALSRLLSSSPELQAAWQKIQHDEITVERERVEPVPNVIAGLTTIHSPVADTTQTTVNVGISLPIFDRNQGTVRQAQADLMQSHAEARRLELELRNRLATQFRVYQTALRRFQDYEVTILPKAKRSFDMLRDSYKARRAAWPDVLAAQRFYLGLRAEQLNNLVMYRESDVAIRGMLLTGGLAAPSSPIGGGHIDAVPKPR